MMIDYTKFVNIEVGTDSEYRESNGNTLPNVQSPFGNQAYVLQSNKNDNGWFYRPRAHYCEGIRVTNQPSPWLGDYGHLTILPYVGNYDIDLHSSLTDKQLTPYSISGQLNRYATNFKLIPTAIGAKLAVDNQSGSGSKLVIDCHQGVSDYKVDGNRLYLTIRNIADGEFSDHYRKFYVLDFDCEIETVTSYQHNQRVDVDSIDNLQLDISLSKAEYQISLASSYISHQYAAREAKKIAKQSITSLEQAVKTEWNKLLATIEIEQPTTVFYSNMYRLFCYPRVISEIDQEGNEVYYNFKKQTVDYGVMIADVGFWDTYRTTMPLYKKIIPTKYKEMIDAIINYYQSYGWLPRWLAPYERGIMPSTLVDSVIATALVEGDVNPQKVSIAIEGLLKNGDSISDNKLFGREYLDLYIEYGYVPSSVAGESVSISLDNYYSDYAIYRALQTHNHPAASRYKTRCMQYQNLFNQHSKMFERVDQHRKFDPNFIADEWGSDFCESSALQNNLNVFHDVPGMIELFGGKAELEQRLDELVGQTPSYNVGRYGFEIHEMTEYAKIRNLGHFAISNQPSFNIPFWYLQVGNQVKFNNLIVDTLEHFTAELDGYPGDEDNGSLAAWYILVSIGIYPFCPVDGMIEFKGQVNYKINEI